MHTITHLQLVACITPGTRENHDFSWGHKDFSYFKMKPHVVLQVHSVGQYVDGCSTGTFIQDAEGNKYACHDANNSWIGLTITIKPVPLFPYYSWIRIFSNGEQWSQIEEDRQNRMRQKEEDRHNRIQLSRQRFQEKVKWYQRQKEWKRMGSPFA